MLNNFERHPWFCVSSIDAGDMECCDRRVNKETPVMKSEMRQFVSPFDDTNYFEESAFIMKSKAYC